MSYLEELLPEFRKGAKIRRKCWGTEEYLFNKKNNVKTQDDTFFELDSDDLMADDWELYQEPINWDYIIKNKCLCWFWGDENKSIGFLVDYERNRDGMYFIKADGYDRRTAYQNCHPVRKDEVTFYEDREE